MPISIKDVNGNTVAMTNAQKAQFLSDLGAASADQLQAKQDKVATIALSADRPLAATDANNNLTFTSARSVTIPTGLGQSFLTHFVNTTSSALNITITGTGGTVINGAINGSVTRSIPANSTLTMRATGADSYNVPDPATTVRGYTSRVPNIRGGNRILNNFGGVSDGGSTQSTSCMKFEFEAPFNAVRVWGFSRYATVTGSFKAIVAPTETMAASPVNDAFQPKIGGAYQNVVQPTHIPNGSNVYSAGTGAFTGWRNVTWAGSTTSPTLSGGAQETPQFICSDIIPVRSVPRTDVSGVPVGRHAAMLRVYNLAGNRPVGDLSTYRARTVGTDWFRNFVCGSVNSDAIATITNQPTTVSDGGGWTFWIEPIYDVPCRHVVNLGDSRAGEWPRSILQYSTPSAPIAYSELTMPGNHTLAVMQAFDRFLTAGSNDCGVTDVILQAVSRNFSPLDRKVAQDVQAMLTGYILKMRSLGIRLFLTTDYVDGTATWNAEREAARQAMISWTRNICAAGLATLVDTDPVITDYSGAQPVIKAGLSADGLHVDDAQETALLSPLMAAAWLAAG